MGASQKQIDSRFDRLETLLQDRLKHLIKQQDGSSLCSDDFALNASALPPPAAALDGGYCNGKRVETQPLVSGGEAGGCSSSADFSGLANHADAAYLSPCCNDSMPVKLVDLVSRCNGVAPEPPLQPAPAASSGSDPDELERQRSLPQNSSVLMVGNTLAGSDVKLQQPSVGNGNNAKVTVNNVRGSGDGSRDRGPGEGNGLSDMIRVQVVSATESEGNITTPISPPPSPPPLPPPPPPPPRREDGRISIGRGSISGGSSKLGAGGVGDAGQVLSQTTTATTLDPGEVVNGRNLVAGRGCYCSNQDGSCSADNDVFGVRNSPHPPGSPMSTFSQTISNNNDISSHPWSVSGNTGLGASPAVPGLRGRLAGISLAELVYPPPSSSSGCA